MSRFKADHLTRAHNHIPIASTSLESSVIPAGSSPDVQRAIRLGRLESDKLVGADDSSSENESEAIKMALEMVKNGSLRDTRSADPSPPITSSFPAARESRVSQPIVESEPQPNTQTSTTSRSHAGEPRPPRSPSAVDHHLPDHSEHLSLSPGPSPSHASPRVAAKHPPAAVHAPGQSNPNAAPQFSMIIDSPSFAPPTSKPENSVRPDRPPIVMSSIVRESGDGTSRNTSQARNSTAQRRVSRFKAERS